MGSAEIALGIVWYVCFLFALTCHEAAHALAAKLGGDLTAFQGGQVTLNPIPHVRREPFGTVIVPILSYILGGWMIGWASAPYDPHWQERHPRRAAWMALAGPLANLAIAIATGVAIRVLLSAGLLRFPSGIGFTSVVSGPDPGVFSGLAAALSVLFSLNLLLAVFNLIPVPPLDGATVVGLFLPEHASRRLRAFLRSGPFALLGILLAWRVMGYIFPGVFRVAIGVLYPELGID